MQSNGNRASAPGDLRGHRDPRPSSPVLSRLQALLWSRPDVSRLWTLACRVLPVVTVALTLVSCAESAQPTLAPREVAGVQAPASTGGKIGTGQTIYMAQCSICHGEQGQGQPDWKVPLPDGSLPAPPHDSSGHTWHHSDAELLRIIREGGTFYMPESKMPAFGEFLDEEETLAVLEFIRSMWGDRERDFQAERNEPLVPLEPASSPTAAEAP